MAWDKSTVKPGEGGKVGRLLIHNKIFSSNRFADVKAKIASKKIIKTIVCCRIKYMYWTLKCHYKGYYAITTINNAACGCVQVSTMTWSGS